MKLQDGTSDPTTETDGAKPGVGRCGPDGAAANADISVHGGDAALDAEGRVAVDEPCIGCGYNVRTLRADGLCPECARPVRDTLDSRRAADRKWRARVTGGALLLGVGLAGVVVEPVMDWLRPDPLNQVFGPVGVLVQILAGGLALVCTPIGVFRLTMRLDVPGRVPGAERWRRSARWYAWVGALALLWAVSASFVDMAPGSHGAITHAATIAVIETACVMLVFMVFKYVGRILSWIPDRRMVGACDALAWIASGALLLLFGSSIAADSLLWKWPLIGMLVEMVRDAAYVLALGVGAAAVVVLVAAWRVLAQEVLPGPISQREKTSN